MKIDTIEFIGSADRPSLFPASGLPEIAFAGRSNVGKSSLINRLLKRKNLARVSTTPGKTRLINFFLVDGKFHLVDLPGYGYARRSKAERQRWAEFLEAYLKNRETLRAVVLLIDVSIPPVASDEEMLAWLAHYGVAVVPVLTKADKAKQAAISRRVRTMKDMGPCEGPLVVSARKGQGIPELWRCLFRLFDD